MKLAILFSLVALCACGSLRNFDSSSDVIEIIQRYGYPSESFDVQTSDGYILQVFRISGGRTNNHQDESTEAKSNENSARKSSEETKELKNRPAVLLMHGVMSDSIDFVIGGPTQGLAFVLADQGYDVYLGNARGSIYGQRHTTLNPKKDAAFWRFCWHQIGVKDLPAIVDKVLSVSGQSKLSYVGHMEGSTAFYVLASEVPEYNQKFDRQISLGPIAFMTNAENEVLTKIVGHKNEKSWVIKHLGMSTFTPSNELIQEAITKCTNEHKQERLCNNAYFLINGYNSQNLNETTINNLLTRVPSSASVREILHFAQLKSSGRFQKYDDSFSDNQVAEYDLSKITVPVAILYTPEDKLSTVEDVEQLVKKLPKVMGSVQFDQLTNNLDLIFSKNVDTAVYQVVLRMLRVEPQKMIKRL